MPQAFAAALYALQGSTALWLSTAAITAISYAAAFATVVGIGAHQRRKAARRARDAFNASLEDRLVMVSTTDAARSEIYGRARNVDGVLFKATRGANSEIYTLVIALKHGESDAIEDVYFGDVPVALDGNGYVLTAPFAQTTRRSAVAQMSLSGGTGSVVLPQAPLAGTVSVTAQLLNDTGNLLVEPVTIAGSTVSVLTAPPDSSIAYVHYQYDELRSYARIRKYLGPAAQDLSADLVADFPGLVTSTDKFRGITLLRADLEYSQDAYPTGLPPISAVVRGAKVYDPRTAGTSWSPNPALHARAWSLHANGGGMSAAAIADADVSAAANACDADASFVRPSGTVVMDTYQSGIVVKLDGDPTAALDEIVEAMAGRWGWAGGTLRLVAGAYRAPVATITEDWITDAADIRIVPAPPRSELVNAITPTIADRELGYVAGPVPRIAPASYIGADGGEYARELQMGAVTHAAHAQHIAGVLLRDAREALTVELPCNFRAWQLELFDTVAVTLPRFGWSAKVFEVLGWRFTLGGGVRLTLKETEAAIFDPDAGFADLGASDNTALPLPWLLQPLTGLGVTSSVLTLADGQIATKTLVAWDPPLDIGVLQSGYVEVQWLQVGSVTGPVSWVNGSSTPVAWQTGGGAPASWLGVSVADPAQGVWQTRRERGDQRSTVIVGLRAGVVYVFRARTESTLGVRSAWTQQVAIRIADTPLVQTEGIADGAATEVLETEVLVDGGASAAYPSFGVPVKLVATATYRAELTRGASNNGLLCLGLRRNASPIGGTIADGVLQIDADPTTPTFRTQHVVRATYSVAANDGGGTVQFRRSFAGVTPGGPSVASEAVHLQVEVIKR